MHRFALRVSLVCLAGFTLACGPGLSPGAGSNGEESGTGTGTDDGEVTTATSASASSGDGDGDTTTSGDGDGDTTTSGDGDGDTTTSGDGDGDDTTTTGDGDGDDTTTTGDGDGDDTTTTGDGDGDDTTTTGDGDGDDTTGDGDGDDTTGDGDGDPDPNPDGFPDGSACTADNECASLNCYVVPFLGGTCGECNQDNDCPDGGCSPPNPFDQTGSVCNMGEAGGGCESDPVCQPGLTCENVFDLLGLIQLNSCSTCATDQDCADDEICTSLVDIDGFSGVKECIPPASLAQDEYCDLQGNGGQACQSGHCSLIDIMGLAEIGSCGECNGDLDCAGNQVCISGEFDIGTGTLSGSSCQ